MLLDELRYYTRGQASSIPRYLVQEIVTAAFGWIPSLPGIALRAVMYHAIAHLDGFPAVERGVRLAYAENIRLGRGVYLDQGVYLHACPGGIEIGDDAFIMSNAELHVFNFRALPHAFIRIGKRTFVGEAVIIRGQGGVEIGDAVLIGPGAQILAINHNHGDPRIPVLDQGIQGEGIVIEDGAWIGAGALILDGVKIGQNAVVGAGAVVTRSVPANGVAVGVPARVISTPGAPAPNGATRAPGEPAVTGSSAIESGLLPPRRPSSSENGRRPVGAGGRSAPARVGRF